MKYQHRRGRISCNSRYHCSSDPCFMLAEHRYETCRTLVLHFFPNWKRLSASHPYVAIRTEWSSSQVLSSLTICSGRNGGHGTRSLMPGHMHRVLTTDVYKMPMSTLQQHLNHAPRSFASSSVPYIRSFILCCYLQQSGFPAKCEV